MELGDVKMEELYEFLNYVNTANELARRLKKLTEKSIETPDWIYYDYDVYELPVDMIKKWRYLFRPSFTNRDVYPVIVREYTYLEDLIVLYKAHEEGLLKEIIEDSRRNVSELRRRKYTLKRAERILEKIGVSTL